MANAQKFAHSPELKAAMEKGGVVRAPIIHFRIRLYVREGYWTDQKDFRLDFYQGLWENIRQLDNQQRWKIPCKIK